MSIFLTILIALAVLATVLSLVLGLLNMTRKSEDHAKRSNRLMQYRVYCQGAALLLLALAFFLSQTS